MEDEVIDRVASALEGVLRRLPGVSIKAGYATAAVPMHIDRLALCLAAALFAGIDSPLVDATPPNTTVQ